MAVRGCDDIMTANCSHWDGVGWIVSVMLAINVSGFSLQPESRLLLLKCLKLGKVFADVVTFMIKKTTTWCVAECCMLLPIVAIVSLLQEI